MIKKISPLTRIEGHLKVEVEVEKGRVKTARISGEMYRGFENLLIGRHPLDAQRITQRVCGVCHEVHGIASSKALADLYNIEPPPNGKLLKDIILALHMAIDHILHFFHLALPDYVDFAAIAAYRGKDPTLLNLKEWVLSQRPYLFTKKVPGDYITDPQVALPLVANYIEAFDKLSLGASALAVFGGKAPFAHTVFPGGVSVELTMDKIAKVSQIVDQLIEFVKTKYLPSVIEVAKHYREYFKIGHGYMNLISYGGFSATGTPLYEPGVMINGKIHPLDVNGIVEDVAHSYYDGPPRSFKEGETKPHFGKKGAYSWVKAPRYKGHPMETGPISRILVTGRTRREFLAFLKREFGVGMKEAFSTNGRNLARAYEALLLLEYANRALSNLKPGESTIVTVDVGLPVSGRGLGLSNAARGELLHYIEAENGRITRYQMVVPSTWNFSPRDSAGKPGPVEKAIEGAPVRFKEGLIEVGRIIRSYDPCTACSIH